MINTTDKTIIDTLLLHAGINLPDIGSLSVRTVPAEFIDAATIKPPHREIVFSKVQNPRLPSAERIQGYRQWLADIVHDDESVQLNGIGTIRSSVFYPSVELHEKLNPQSTAPVAVRRKHNNRMMWISVSTAAVILIALIYAGLRVSEAVDPEPYVIESGITNVTSVTAVISEPAAATEPANNTAGYETETSEPPAAGSETTAAATETPKIVYHIVAGVFSNEENADKMIAGDPLGIGLPNYRKLPFGTSRTLVSAFASEDRPTAETRMRELRKTNEDLWIYEQKFTSK